MAGPAGAVARVRAAVDGRLLAVQQLHLRLLAALQDAGYDGAAAALLRQRHDYVEAWAPESLSVQAYFLINNIFKISILKIF